MSFEKTISWEEIKKAAEKLNVEPCALSAVHIVESSGAGFLPSGRPKILFEGHVFWRELKAAGLDPAALATQHPNIIYPKWTKQFYKGGEAEHDRLTEALKINNEAALKSASWGAFQLMGFNYKSCGYNSVADFVAAMSESAGAQLLALVGFLKAQKLDMPLRAKNWAGFAKGYNGAGYAQNKYDSRLAQAYKACLAKGQA